MVSMVINLLAGLGAFLIGFKILSDNIEKLSTKGLKKLFKKTSNNKLVGVGIGMGATAIVQSSSATTVMVVGFVNAGIMTLFQATTVIMGANIGTTITAQIVALKSFDITEYAMLLSAIGIFMNLFAKKDKPKTIGYALAGLGLVFVGLEFMSNSMAAFKENESFINLFRVISNPVLLMLIGAAFTAIVQSSSAVTSIVITMVGAGITIGSGGNSVLFVVLGTNIGTCITALISSIGASKNGKRASLIHLMFNTFGSLVFLIILLIFKDFKDGFLAKAFPNPETQIAMFHTIFNILCTLLFLPFTNIFVKLSTLIIRDKEESENVVYMDERIISSPPIAIAQVKKEMGRLYDITINSLNTSFNNFIEVKDDPVDIEMANILNEEIVKYLVKISSSNVSAADEKEISVMHHSLTDIMRVNEIADNFIKYTKDRREKDVEFSHEVLAKIRELYNNVVELGSLSIKAFVENTNDDMDRIDELEGIIDKMRKELINEHIERLNKGLCKAESCNTFICLVNNLERVADHLNIVAHAGN